MEVFLKYHIPRVSTTIRSPYWYLGIKFKATDQLYNLDMRNEFNDFNKNIKLGNTFETFMYIFKTTKQVFKKFTKTNILDLYDNCLMRVGNLYTSENSLDNYCSSNEISDVVPIQYSLAFYSFDTDPCIYTLDVPLKILSLDKYKYDFRSWMIHRSIQELN